MTTNKITDILTLIMVVVLILTGMTTLNDETVYSWAFVDLYSVVVLIIFANRLFEQKSSGIMHYRVTSALLALASLTIIIGNIITPFSWVFFDIFSISVALLAILHILTNSNEAS